MHQIQTVFGTIGLFLMAAGVLIWYYRLIHLLNDFRDKPIHDPAGLARWSGLFFIWMGIVLFGTGWLVERANTERTQFEMLCGMVVLQLLSTRIYQRGGARYLEK